jgi:hypothetical protein
MFLQAMSEASSDYPNYDDDDDDDYDGGGDDDEQEDKELLIECGQRQVRPLAAAGCSGSQLYAGAGTGCDQVQYTSRLT